MQVDADPDGHPPAASGRCPAECPGASPWRVARPALVTRRCAVARCFVRRPVVLRCPVVSTKRGYPLGTPSDFLAWQGLFYHHLADLDTAIAVGLLHDVDTLLRDAGTNALEVVVGDRR